MSSLQRFSLVLLLAGPCFGCGGSSPEAVAGPNAEQATSSGAAAGRPAVGGSQAPVAGGRSTANAAAGSGGAKSNGSQASAPLSSAGSAGSSAGAGGSAPAAIGGAGAAGSSGSAAGAAASAGASGSAGAAAGSGSHFVDSFDGDGPLMGYTTNNESAIPDVSRVSGRYNAKVLTNANDVTLHYNQSQGRIDARKLSFPFEAIARNMGVGTVADSQTAAPGGGVVFNLAGMQVRVLEFESRNSAHLVVGHSGTANFSIEGKSTVNGTSVWDNEGANAAPIGRADLRIVGNADRTISVYWQAPNADPAAKKDDWKPYKGTGKLGGPAPKFESEVYVGLITYAVGETGVPFVGTCDSFETIQQ